MGTFCACGGWRSTHNPNLYPNTNHKLHPNPYPNADPFFSPNNFPNFVTLYRRCKMEVNDQSDGRGEEFL